MSGRDDEVARAFRGEGPLFATMLAERARALAAPAVDEAGTAEMAVLTLKGRTGRWVLPLAAVARIDVLAPAVPVPDMPAAVLGLALLSGRRCLLADLDALVAGAPVRRADRPGHAVLLRGWALALAVERAEAVAMVPPPDEGRQMLADGSLLLDARGLAIRLGLGRGGKP